MKGINEWMESKRFSINEENEMKNLNEWIDGKKDVIDEAEGKGWFEMPKKEPSLISTQKEVDAAQKNLVKTRSIIIAMGKNPSSVGTWEFDVHNFIHDLSDEWNRVLEAYGIYPGLKIMKYQGTLAECFSCLWNSMVAASVGQHIGHGYRSLSSFSKYAKALYKAYDRVLLVKPINLKK